MICLRVRELNIPSSASLIYQTQSEVIHLKVNARKPELTIYFRVRALIDSRHSSLRHQHERLAHEVYLRYNSKHRLSSSYYIHTSANMVSVLFVHT